MFSIHKDFLPKFEVLFRKGYSWKGAYNDFCAALGVAMVSLPFSMALAIAAGASPQQGIVCGIVMGFLVSLLGGSRYAIAGPAGAFVVVIYDVIARHGMDGLGTATIMGGGILILFGFLKLGNFIRFIPYPLTIGFTTGLALLIFLGQFKDTLGMPTLSEPGFTQLVYHLMTHIKQPEPLSMLVSLITLFLAFFFKKVRPKWSWPFMSIGIATLSVLFLDLQVPTLGSKFGSLSLFPWPLLPSFQWKLIPGLFSDAFTIAALAGIEGLLCCVMADSLSGSRHRSNVELVAQGIAMATSAFLGGIPGTNSISRTAANIRAGGYTPMAGIFQAFILFVIFAFLGPLCSSIPLASLAAMLMIVTWNMADFPRFFQQFKAPLPDILVMLATFLLTILINITTAVQIGMIMAAFLFVYQQSKRVTLLKLKAAMQETEKLFNLSDLPPSTDVYQMQGPLFFGALDGLKSLLKQAEVPKFLILNMDRVSDIDASGMQMLKTLYSYLKEHGCELHLVGSSLYVKKRLDRYGLTTSIGDFYFSKDLHDAVEKIRQIYKKL